MPFYGFKCAIHGEFEIFQSIHAVHIANCPQCKRVSERVFYPLALHGDLPSKDPRPGKTRGELLDNMAKEGFYNKEWREQDESEVKQWTDAGVKEKPFFGWTPALGT